MTRVMNFFAFSWALFCAWCVGVWQIVKGERLEKALVLASSSAQKRLDVRIEKVEGTRPKRLTRY